MVNITVGTATSKKSLLVDASSTINSVLKEANISASSPTLNLNGAVLAVSDRQKTLLELGVEDGGNATLMAVVKADSAI